MRSVLECLSRKGSGLSLLSTQNPVRRLSGIFVALAISLSSSTVLAGWTDPLDTPAAATEKAHQTLLLDVTRAGDRLVAVGAYGHVIYSDDNGQSWKQGKVPVTVTLTAVDFADAQYGWAVGHDGIILASQDGGLSWNKQFDGYLANEALVAAAEKRTRELEQQQTEAIDPQLQEDLDYQLEDALMALDDARYDVEQGSTKPFLDVLFLSRNDGFALGAYGMLFRTRDGGKSWHDIAADLPNPDKMHLSQLAVLGDDWLIVGEMGLVIRSRDYGQSWERLELPYDGSLFGAVQSGQDWLVFGLRGNVFASSDHGDSWRQLPTGSEQTLLSGSVARNGAVALVGNAGTLVTLERDNVSSTPLIRIMTLEGRSGLAAGAAVGDGWLVVGEAGARAISASEFKQSVGE